MPKRDVERFAELLIKLVRDEAVASCKALTSPESNAPEAQRWRRGGAPSEDVIADIVDATLFELLSAIDCGALPLKFVSTDGRAVSLEKEGKGEMAGSYMMSGGWRQRFSRELVVDDLADLE